MQLLWACTHWNDVLVSSKLWEAVFCGLPMFTLQTEGRNSSLLITPRSVFHFNISLPIYTAYMCQDMSSISNWKQISLYIYYSLHAYPVQINLCLQALRTTTHLYGIAPSFQKDMQPKNTTSSTDTIFQHIRNSNTSEISTTPYDRLLPWHLPTDSYVFCWAIRDGSTNKNVLAISIGNIR